MERSLVLTGPMGSGKTTVGRYLASLLGTDFVDLDALVVLAAGKSINDIFSEDGEEFFRQLEHDQLAGLVGRSRMVLSTGGGAVLREDNRTLMKKIGVVVNLFASVELLVERLSKSDDRPLLKTAVLLPERIAALLSERGLCYADCDIRIDTGGKSVEDVASELLKRLSEGC